MTSAFCIVISAFSILESKRNKTSPFLIDCPSVKLIFVIIPLISEVTSIASSALKFPTTSILTTILSTLTDFASTAVGGFSGFAIVFSESPDPEIIFHLSHINQDIAAIKITVKI